MIIKIATKVNKNGNSYGLVIDTENKTYNYGNSVCAWNIDFHVSKEEILEIITYKLKPNGYKLSDDI